MRDLGASVPASKGRAGFDKIAIKLLGLTVASTADEYLHQRIREPLCLLQLRGFCRVINFRIERQLAADLKCAAILWLGLGRPLGQSKEKAEPPFSQCVCESDPDLR